MRVAQVSAEATHDLRRRVLREGRADGDVVFAGDTDARAVHLAVVDDEDRPVAVLTAIPSACPERVGRGAWKVRGMAVEPGLQGRGLGGRLLEEIEVRAAAAGVDVLWADARDPALAFYRRHRWSVEGEGFTTPDTGLPHHRAILDLGGPGP